MPTPQVPAILGRMAQHFAPPTQIGADLWGVFCLPPQTETPLLVGWFGDGEGESAQARATRFVAWLQARDDVCRHCRTRFDRHRLLEAVTFAEQRQQDRARAEQEAEASRQQARTAQKKTKGLTLAEIEAREAAPPPPTTKASRTRTPRSPQAAPPATSGDPFEEDV
jgi:hypothetical protein